jgi:ketosteroid isomerase-like protein
MLAFAFLAGQRVGAQNHDVSEEHELIELSKTEVNAFGHKDAETLARIWSNDFVVTNPFNKFLKKEDVLGMVRSGMLVISPYERAIEYLRIYGDMAIMVGTEQVTWGGRMPNAGKIDQLRFTAVWRKQQGHWQEIARHANVVPNQVVSH